MHNCLTLERTVKTRNATGGILLEGKPGIPSDNILCRTLELPWQDNKARVSCIPVTEQGYTLTRRFSPKAHKTWGYDYVWDIAVPGRQYIMFHPGNTHRDTLGCILPVSSLGIDQETGAVVGVGSRIAQNALTAFLETKQEWHLFITDQC